MLRMACLSCFGSQLSTQMNWSPRTPAARGEEEEAQAVAQRGPEAVHMRHRGLHALLRLRELPLRAQARAPPGMEGALEEHRRCMSKYASACCPLLLARGANHPLLKKLRPRHLLARPSSAARTRRSSGRPASSKSLRSRCSLRLWRRLVAVWRPRATPGALRTPTEWGPHSFMHFAIPRAPPGAISAIARPSLWGEIVA